MSGRMHVSLNEIDALARKSARGACLPWGIAEETGKSARRLASWGVDPVAALAQLLERHHGADDLAWRLVVDDGDGWRSGDGKPPSTAFVAPALCDHARPLCDGMVIRVSDVAWPIFLLPAVYWAARMAGCAVTARIDDAAWTACPDGRVAGDAGGFANTSAARTVVVRSTTVPPEAAVPRTSWIGLETATHEWERLERLAAHTYVPASEQSRARGAGAGDIDND